MALSVAEIKRFIQDDISSEKKRRAAVGQRYYEAKHDILDCRLFYWNDDGILVEDKTRSNIKISHPFFMILADQLSAYALSKSENPIQAKKKDDGLQDLLDEVFDDDFWYGFTGTPKVEESTTAYVKFLNGNYAYLLGTQRDACRFVSRGVLVYAKPLEEFSDLQHSIALLKTENKKACEGFIRYLLSEKSQKLVSSIGMLSPEYDIYSVDDILHDAIEKSSCRYTVSPFMDDRAIEEMQNAAQAALRGDNKEVLKNFLKVS